MGLILVAVLYYFILSVNVLAKCPLPSMDLLTTELKVEVVNSGGEGSVEIIVLDGPYYTCMVQGTSMGTYQELSVIMEYRQSGQSFSKIGQFELVCIESLKEWTARSESLITVTEVDVSLWTNCSSCINTADNDQHCAACDPACDSGLMRCTGSGSDDCCAAFDDEVCSSTLNCSTEGHVANTLNNFTCTCDISCPDGYTANTTSCTCTLTDICVADNPCNNGGACKLGSSPDQYTCNCTGTGYIGTNCTVCPECPDGYSMFTSNCSCYQSHICLINNPCANGGSCTILDDSDSNYTCTCTSNYEGPDCTVCPITCPDGYTVDSTCTSCLLKDTCVVNDPCTNGGTCVLGSTPHQYTCNCTGTGYIGTNCTECSLHCLNGGSATPNCSSCKCDPNHIGDLCETPIDYCEGVDSCGINGHCVNDYDNNGYMCSCSSGWEGPTCTSCTVPHCNECTGNPPVCRSCDQGYETSSSGYECVLNDLCPLTPCRNGGSCRSVPGSYECVCPSIWDGVNCTVCAEGYGKSNGTCVPCDIGNCRSCPSDHGSCSSCVTGYSLSSDRAECLFEANRYTLIWIIVCSVVGFLLIVIIVVIIVMASIRITGGSGSKSNRIRKTSAFQRGTVNNNPLYVSTDDLKDENIDYN